MQNLYQGRGSLKACKKQFVYQDDEGIAAVTLSSWMDNPKGRFHISMEKNEIRNYMKNVSDRVDTVMENLTSLKETANVVKATRRFCKDDLSYYKSKEFQELMERESMNDKEINVISLELKALRKTLCNAAMASLCMELLENEKAFDYPCHFKKFESIFKVAKEKAFAPVFVEERENTYTGETHRIYGVYAYINNGDWSKEFSVSSMSNNEKVHIWSPFTNEGKLNKESIQKYLDTVTLPDYMGFHDLAKRYLETKATLEKKVDDLYYRISKTMKEFNLIRTNESIQKYFYF